MPDISPDTPAVPTTVTPPPSPMTVSSPADGPTTPAPSATSQAPAAPTASATPSALSQPPARPSATSGILSSITLGALAGAASHIAKKAGQVAQTAGGGVKQGFKNLAANSPRGQELQANALARQAEQQRMQLASQKASQESTQAMDEHTEAGIRAHILTMNAVHTALQNKHEESLYPGQEEQARIGLMADRQKIDAANTDILSTIASEGVPVDERLVDQLSGADAKDIGVDGNTMISNGKTGSEAGVGIINMRALANTPLSQDKNMITDWKIDPKTKSLTPVYGTLTAGNNSLMDLLVTHNGAQKKFDELQGQQAKTFTDQKTQADIANANAEAGAHRAQTALTEEQTNQMRKFGVTVPPNYTPPANIFSMSMPEIQQQLASQNIQMPPNFADLYAMGHYKMDPATFSNRPYNRAGSPVQMSMDNAKTFVRNFVNPNYDDTTYPAIKKMAEEFASTRNNTAGGNLIAFNTATGHLGQLYDASEALKNGNIPRLNEIANALGVETGGSAPVVYNGIKTALVGELGKTFKNAAPDVPERDDISKTLSNSQSPQQAQDLAKTYAHLMLTKAGGQIAHYYAYTGELPPQTIDPNAAKVYQEMGIDVNDVLPSGASKTIGQTGNNLTPDLQNTHTNPQTKQQIGWDGKAWVDAKTRQPLQAATGGSGAGQQISIQGPQ